MALQVRGKYVFFLIWSERPLEDAFGKWSLNVSWLSWFSVHSSGIPISKTSALTHSFSVYYLKLTGIEKRSWRGSPALSGSSLLIWFCFVEKHLFSTVAHGSWSAQFSICTGHRDMLVWLTANRNPIYQPQFDHLTSLLIALLDFVVMMCSQISTITLASITKDRIKDRILLPDRIAVMNQIFPLPFIQSYSGITAVLCGNVQSAELI